MMRCPRCQQGIHRGAEVCPHCGFGLADFDAPEAVEIATSRRLEDRAGLMRQHERQKVARAMDRFDAKFPDLFFAVHTSRLSRAENLHQFGLWLLNRVPISDLGEGRRRDGGIALILDPDHKQATMTWGYRLDPVLTEHDTFLALSRAHAYWVEGQFAAGILRAIEQTAHTLVKRARQVRRHPERFGPLKTHPEKEGRA